MVTVLLFSLALGIGLERFFELRLSRRNRLRMLEAGGCECGARHYPLMISLHVLWFIGWITEGAWRAQLDQLWPLWLGLFVLGDLLRYWCILSLRGHWSTKIVVLPGKKLVRAGPYRFFRHPIYFAVVIILFSVPMIFGAWI